MARRIHIDCFPGDKKILDMTWLQNTGVITTSYFERFTKNKCKKGLTEYEKTVKIGQVQDLSITDS